MCTMKDAFWMIHCRLSEYDRSGTFYIITYGILEIYRVAWSSLGFLSPGAICHTIPTRSDSNTVYFVFVVIGLSNLFHNLEPKLTERATYKAHSVEKSEHSRCPDLECCFLNIQGINDDNEPLTNSLSHN